MAGSDDASPADSSSAGDDTVRMAPPAAAPARGTTLRWPALAGAGLLLAGALAFALWPGRTAPPAPPPVVVADTEPAPRFVVRRASESTILNHRAETLAVFSLEASPAILVLDFPDLRQQGLMLNRVAALVEKHRLPRDRLLSDAELDAAIREAGDTVETYYYGHDYGSDDLVRFFALADRDGVALNAEEQTLRALLRQQGFLAPNAGRALISIPREDAGPGIDRLLRATILRHELSHAEFFSNPDYAAYARRFWAQGLDASQRAAFQKFLLASDYDPEVPDLFVNEMQAYLMHTGDRRLFSAASLGIAADDFARLQATFLLGMPPGWLRDCTTLPSGITVTGGQSGGSQNRRRPARNPVRRTPAPMRRRQAVRAPSRSPSPAR